MRPGELCALTWEDIDFENKVNILYLIRKRMKMVSGILAQQKLKVEKDRFILVQHL